MAAVPYHRGRYQGLAQDEKRSPLSDLMRNAFFDTCVYHQPGIDLLFKVVPHDVLFASEMVGAVNGVDPETGCAYDDTKRYVEAAGISDDDWAKVCAGTALRTYPRLAGKLADAGLKP